MSTQVSTDDLSDATRRCWMCGAPSWLRVYHRGIGNVGTGIGLVLGFVAALLGMAWERKRSGRQSANTYPPIVSLRQLGWSFISD